MVRLRVFEVIQAPQGGGIGGGGVALAQVVPALLVQVPQQGALQMQLP